MMGESMRRFIAFAILAVLAAGCQPAAAPPAPAPPPSTAVRDSLKATDASVKDNILKSAEQMQEALLAYQPTKEVRTSGQILGHIANENYVFCGAASGGKGPADDFEKLTKKADLQKALADSFAFCDQAFDGLNDQTGAEAAEIAAFGIKGTKLSMLAFNTTHNGEHYGNLVTYMRLNKIVPPSSQPRGQ
jgi:uncharacterized damage-inducible protein DinB